MTLRNVLKTQLQANVQAVAARKLGELQARAVTNFLALSAYQRLLDVMRPPTLEERLAKALREVL